MLILFVIFLSFTFLYMNAYSFAYMLSEASPMQKNFIRVTLILNAVVIFVVFLRMVIRYLVYMGVLNG